MNEIKEQLYHSGCLLTTWFCSVNKITCPSVNRLGKGDRLYHLATCAYYRPQQITIMVEKCAHIGRSASAWSCPGYVIDRTPYGVLQHELGHHVDYFLTRALWDAEGTPFCERVCVDAQEGPLTGYLGTDHRQDTYYKEWFAEMFRLYVTNSELLRAVRPKTYAAIRRYLLPVIVEPWEQVLRSHNAPERTVAMAQIKIDAKAARV